MEVRGRGRWLVAGLLVVSVAVAGVVLARTRPLARQDHGAGAADNGTHTSTATVTRRSLSSRTSVGGALGYSGDYTVLGQGGGAVTRLPAPGLVIRQGQPLYWVAETPVLLLYGSVPAYRTLAEGATASDTSGRDVRQLNRDLVALGCARGLGLDASSDEFSWATRIAVQRLQARLGIARTGRLDLGRVVFLPSAARVTSVSATLGGPAGGPVLKATSATRLVTVDLDATEQSQVKLGDRVAITLPNGHTTPGRVSSIGKVATPGSGTDSAPKVEVQISPTQASATGHLDQAPVQVVITTGTVRNALVVPVAALLAVSGGGYAVELAGTDSADRLLRVSLGLFDDSAGLVQVSGTGLGAGQRVVVPAS
jgi:hypothetical protein